MFYTSATGADGTYTPHPLLEVGSAALPAT